MVNLNSYIIEKLKINRNTKLEHIDSVAFDMIEKMFKVVAENEHCDYSIKEIELDVEDKIYNYKSYIQVKLTKDINKENLQKYGYTMTSLLESNLKDYIYNYEKDRDDSYLNFYKLEKK